jgi:hypothetical protein
MGEDMQDIQDDGGKEDLCTGASPILFSFFLPYPAHPAYPPLSCFHFAP